MLLATKLSQGQRIEGLEPNLVSNEANQSGRRETHLHVRQGFQNRPRNLYHWQVQILIPRSRRVWSRLVSYSRENSIIQMSI
jgi:hypothetical protein